MNACIFLLALFVSPCTALVQDDSKNRPVSKVITLLKDMIEQLEKEAEEDEEVYETMGCWCVTNDKAKTKSIADSESAISDLTAAIEGFTANSAKLNTEIANLQKEIAKNSEALDSATAMREKELAEFNAEEKETLVTISSLKSAVIALSKHHDAAMLQTESSSSTMASITMTTDLHRVLRKHSDMLSPRQRKVVASFLQEFTGYEPASGEIFGILKQMKESFETNLANSQKEEMQSQKDYEDLKKPPRKLRSQLAPTLQTQRRRSWQVQTKRMLSQRKASKTHAMFLPPTPSSLQV